MIYFYQLFRQFYKVIVLVFFLCFSLFCAFIFTRPTMYQSTTTLQIGRSHYFVEPGQVLYSTPETLAHLYSGLVDIRGIKSTSLIQISTKQKSRAEAEALVRTVLNAIIDGHAVELAEKRKFFISALDALMVKDTARLILAVDAASASTLTKQVSAISTTAMPFAGLLYGGLYAAALVSALLALMVATGLEMKKTSKYDSVSASL